MNELVSVIIPTRNSADTIETCLKTIKNQTYPNIEIIVVDNYSKDGTADIAGKYAKVLLKDSERNAARNYGAMNAKGDYFVHIDSDMELTPAVIEECVRKANEGIDAIIIPEISVGEGFWAACKALERSCYIGDDTIEAARFFSKDAFLSVNGYWESEKLLFGEDWDFSQRVKKAGYKFGRINSLIKHHESKGIILLITMKKKYASANTFRIYAKRHPEVTKKQLVIIRPAFVRNWRRFLRDPVHAAGVMIMKCCEFAAGGFGLLVTGMKK